MRPTVRTKKILFALVGRCFSSSLSGLSPLIGHKDGPEEANQIAGKYAQLQLFECNI